ncbi:protein DOWN-REGULATED IN DIF1 11-like [Ricinus communis]|uniref:protein DOWN-REGULATED IN DIF1 11-like n=1 Tax=Ricinus communis TaxID=3988 RepID=UPI00201A7343|nr:protein DOWN-REGULATED IN DIF1 11-like [Ricinus communis]
MVRLNNLFISVLLIQASAVIINMSKFASGLDFGAPTPSQEPLPGLYKFLDECGKQITKECGKEIFKSVFLKGIVANDCCVELVSMGETCHNEMVKYIAHGPQFKAHLEMYLAKGEEVYKNCIGTPVPLARSIRI